MSLRSQSQPGSAATAAAPRPIPGQPTREAAPDHRDDQARGARVVTFHDGTGWSYRVEGEPELGHRFADRGPAVAGGQFLARSLGAELVIEDRDGSCEGVSYSEVCGCHARKSVTPGV